MIMTKMIKSDSVSIRSCIRCGTCCKKGGPALHRDDAHLIQDGIIPSKDLFTIRKDEAVYDNVKGFIFPAPSDIIKIKNRLNSAACAYFDETTRRCTIYTHRPVECRILECWNTRDIEKRYSAERLTRKDLLSTMQDIWRLVSDHNKRCSYTVINRFMGPIGKTLPEKVSPEVQEMVQYDIHFRKLLAEKGGIDPDLMDFLFGKPLHETLRRYGIQIRRSE